jgi:Putative ER transporter, 6TM, N-terminal
MDLVPTKTIGPLLPTTNYTIVSSVLISTAAYIAIGSVCCVLIFPESMNHSYLDSLVALLGSIKRYNELYDSILKLTPQQIAEDRDGAVRNAIAHRPLLITNLNACESAFHVSFQACLKLLPAHSRTERPNDQCRIQLGEMERK